MTALRQVRALAFLVCAFGCAGQGPSADVLVFTRTTGFCHASIPAGIAAMRALCAQTGHSVDATEDPAVFRDAVLSRVKAVVFLNTTGTVLSDDQRAAIERWVSGGGGFLGVHSAADTEYGWPFYGELLGARFASHPAGRLGGGGGRSGRQNDANRVPHPGEKLKSSPVAFQRA